MPGHDSGAAPIDVVRRRFRPELVNSRCVTCNLPPLSGTAIPHVESQASGFVGTFARLTQHETTIMRLQRPVVDRKLPQLMIAHVDPDQRRSPAVYPGSRG